VIALAIAIKGVSAFMIWGLMIAVALAVRAGGAGAESAPPGREERRAQ
jgi:hypothetical protein